jgi:hypothetical protein
MNHVIRKCAPVLELDFEIARLRQLLHDLKRVRSGQRPEPDYLASSPTIISRLRG